ncbi:MAG: InlB B-repeat-containing protein, partial [Actinomycetes bacterium]|nr:InlB B-repeat-containing protein [Actinomycetes bacterium]
MTEALHTQAPTMRRRSRALMALLLIVALVVGALPTGLLAPAVAAAATVGAVKAYAAGSAHIVVIRDDGTLWAWGRNDYGKLGDGSTTTRTYPVQVGTDTDWASVSCGDDHTAAIKTDGSLWAWGYGANGRLGDGTTNDHHTPVRIGTDVDWQFVECGGEYTEAIKTNGELYGWGLSNIGQVGDGTDMGSVTGGPSQVDAEIKVSDSQSDDVIWATVSAGNEQTLAVGTNGTLWEWGGAQPYFAEHDQHYPTQMGTDADWASVAVQGRTAYALKTDGTLYGWGANTYGQLGDGTTTGRKTMAQIGATGEWAMIATGGGLQSDMSFALALKKDGTLWAWGYGNRGQLGNGTTAFVNSTPVQVGSDNDWIDICACGTVAMARKADGSLWIWGSNTNGLTCGTTAGSVVSTPRKTTPVTVRLDARDGSNPSAHTFDLGDDEITLPTLSDPDRDFLGWFTEPDAGTELTTMGLFTGETTLYAHWMEYQATPSIDIRHIVRNTHDITLPFIAGAEYSVGDSASWQDANTFDNLQPGTAYTFAVRMKAATDKAASEAVRLLISTKSLQNTPVISSNDVTATATTVTLPQVAGAEYSRDGINWQSGNVFSGLTPDTDYVFSVRLKATTDAAASDAATLAFRTLAAPDVPGGGSDTPDDNNNSGDTDNGNNGGNNAGEQIPGNTPGNNTPGNTTPGTGNGGSTVTVADVRTIRTPLKKI